LLISKSVYGQVQHHFICETGGSTRVKGKTDAIEVFKVKGYLDEQGQPVLVETPYSSYAAEKSDKVVHEDHGGEAPAKTSEITAHSAVEPVNLDLTQLTVPLEALETTLETTSSQMPPSPPLRPVPPPPPAEATKTNLTRGTGIPLPPEFTKKKTS
jgi:hypothetical protein